MVFSEYDNAVDYTPYRINPWSRYRIYDRDRDYLDVTDQIKCQAAKNIVLGKAGYLNDTRTLLAYNGSGTCKRKRYE